MSADASESLGIRASDRPPVGVALAALRPAQWVKNLVVLVPGFFALWDRSQPQGTVLRRAGDVVLAAVAFCLVSSGIYVLNDLFDRVQDRLHPVKRLRPIAAGTLSPRTARTMVAVLLPAGLAVSGATNARTLAVLAGYIVLQVLYTGGLKRVGVLDVFVIASGFVLRALAGATAARVDVSAWLLLCTFLLALFIAVCKRRHEKQHLAEKGGEHRAVLDRYDLRALDQFIAVTAAAAILSYAVYTQAPETVLKFGTRALGATVPFVVFGIFRYMDLLYRRADGDRPERVLLTDPPMILAVLLYAATAVAAFLWGTMR